MDTGWIDPWSGEDVIALARESYMFDLALPVATANSQEGEHAFAAFGRVCHTVGHSSDQYHRRTGDQRFRTATLCFHSSLRSYGVLESFLLIRLLSIDLDTIHPNPRQPYHKRWAQAKDTARGSP